MSVRTRRSALAGLVAVVAIGIARAHAMQFHSDALDDPPTRFGVRADGEIIPGDVDRLRELAGSLRNGPASIAAYALDSPGGDIIEAEKLATVIRLTHATVVVRRGGQCVSACFLLFAAAAKKVIAQDALIGVHSASQDGRETPASMAFTTAMARDAATLGVPVSIIGKMVETKPGSMEWLTRDDLAAMDVVILPTAPAPTETTAANAPSTPAGSSDADRSISAPAATPDEPVAFQQGLSDRRSWEQWFVSLSGDYRGGAVYWSAHRSDPKPPSCYPNGQNVGSWTAGCAAAQQRLAPDDVRRVTEPDYRRGWNSY